jgi:hypothetical protein
MGPGRDATDSERQKVLQTCLMATLELVLLNQVPGGQEVQMKDPSV